MHCQRPVCRMVAPHSLQAEMNHAHGHVVSAILSRTDVRSNCKTHPFYPCFHLNKHKLLIVFPFQFCCRHQRPSFSQFSCWIPDFCSETLKILLYSLLEVNAPGLKWKLGESDADCVCSQVIPDVKFIPFPWTFGGSLLWIWPDHSNMLWFWRSLMSFTVSSLEWKQKFNPITTPKE